MAHIPPPPPSPPVPGESAARRRHTGGASHSEPRGSLRRWCRLESSETVLGGASVAHRYTQHTAIMRRSRAWLLADGAMCGRRKVSLFHSTWSLRSSRRWHAPVWRHCRHPCGVLLQRRRRRQRLRAPNAAAAGCTAVADTAACTAVAVADSAACAAVAIAACTAFTAPAPFLPPWLAFVVALLEVVWRDPPAPFSWFAPPLP